MKKRNDQAQTEERTSGIKIIDLDIEPISHLTDALPQGYEKAAAYDETASDEAAYDDEAIYDEASYDDEAAYDEVPHDEITKQTLPAPRREDSGRPRAIPFHINPHLVFFALIIGILLFVVWRISHFGTLVDPDEYEAPEYLGENMDSIIPFRLPEDMENPADDGVTTIVALGNAPFADDRDSKDNLANLIAEMEGAVVYNCSFPNSYLAASGEPLIYSPQDAFNFYWLTLDYCTQEVAGTYEELFRNEQNSFSDEDLNTFRTLMSIDFNTVDMIVILYDASDYLAGHEMYNDNSDTDIKQFTGNLVAGIRLIRDHYPHIRIIVMSPPYAHAINEDGEYVSSESYRYGWDTLSTYMIKEAEYVYHEGVTFIDNLYGSVDESNADKYLVDNLHLSIEGRKAIARRLVDAIHYYDQDFSEEEE